MATQLRRGHWHYCWCERHFVYCWCDESRKYGLRLKTYKLRALERTPAGLRTLRTLRAMCVQTQRGRAWERACERMHAYARRRGAAPSDHTPSKSSLEGQETAF